MDAAIIGRIALETAIPEASVSAVVNLLKNGSTGPFIVRYRKEATGGMDEEKVRAIQDRMAHYRRVLNQRAILVKSLLEQGRLTDELRAQIEGSFSRTELADLEHQFRPRKKTRAMEAIEKGLQPLAEFFWNQEADAWSAEERIDVFVDPSKGVLNREQALEGVVDILAEYVAENFEHRKKLREMLWSEGRLVSSVVPAKVGQKTKYTMYYDRKEAVTTIPCHRVLAIRRGCKEGVLISSIEGDNAKAIEFLVSAVLRDRESLFAPVIEAAVRESYNRILRPMIESEVRTELKERADREAIRIFQENLANLLLSPPAGPIVAMGVDWGKGNECSVAVIDETGRFLEGARVRFSPVATATTAGAAPAAPKAAATETAAPEADATEAATPGAEATETAAPGAEASEAATPGAEATETAAPEADATEAATPEADATETTAPEADASEAATPEADASEAATPGAETTGTTLPKAAATITETLQTAALEVAASDDPARESPAPEASTPETKARETAAPVQDAGAIIRDLITRHKVRAVAFGTGAKARQLESILRQIVSEAGLDDIMIAGVNDAGMAIYASSRIAREELPDSGASLRCACSLARRLQDPLAELVKIDPKLIGVGQYQHDVDQKELHRGLIQTVQYCVNSVGVNPNTAGVALLRYVSGLNDKLARKIVDFRNSQDSFRSRAGLKTAIGLEDSIYRQAAGFLRIPDGDHPLDQTAIHPEAYPVVEKIAAALGLEVRELLGNRERVTELKIEDFATEEVGLPTLDDIRQELLHPGRDPRKSFRVPKFRPDVRQMSDLQPGMTLEGTVTNVTNFGAFVDIGVHQDGLVHLSQMSNRFIRNPREAVKVGDIVQVKVLSVEMDTQRIGLSMKALLQEGRRRQKPKRRPRKANATSDPDARNAPRPDRSKSGRPREASGRRRGLQKPEGSRRPEDARKPERAPLAERKEDPVPDGPQPTLQEKIAILQSKFRGIH
ncbi:MAG: Tex-like N-terminal domain-containing protein [Acidobacteriota bacterium]|nr:Tex-like N-terminal domain-containing protein [Acidobacteriota bacterium]NLT33496.1 S1 RNA-binding domain-containing protein [Acidobacteriota bacterium]